MKKIITVTIIASLALFLLQIIWISNTYYAYKEDSLVKIENTFSIALGKDVSCRKTNLSYSKYSNKVYYKYAKDMTPEEKEKYKLGDTIDISKANTNRVGDTYQDIILQLRQDGLMKTHPISLPLLDSIYIDLLPFSFPHCIVSMDRDKVVQEIYGQDIRSSRNVMVSKVYPIGTKGLQFLQVYIKIPLSDYLKEMTYILIVSVSIILIVFFILIFQLVVIRKKEEMLCARESTLNGTIHDLKAPLGNIITLLAWMSEDEKDEEKKEIIISSSKKIHNLINDIEILLTASRTKHSRMSLDFSYSDPVLLAEAAINRIHSNLISKRHTINIQNKIEGEMIHGDKMKLENVLKNLIENSLKYSDDGVEIEIIFDKEEKYHSVSVCDNGWGIDPKYQTKIFREFYQAPSQKGKCRSGYGIGLSFSKQIIELHKGKIKLTSALGKGTTVTCYLPL